jgi:hypothetical protein
MKLSFHSALALSSQVVMVVSSASGVFRPHRIAYEALVNEQGAFDSSTTQASLFKDALTNVGMVSVTGIFKDSQVKKETLSWLHECAMESDATVEHTYPDGTVRRTMATHTVPGGVQTIDHKTGKAACDSFSKSSDVFRSKVAEATRAFAARLSSVLDIKNAKEGPLLSTETEFSFATIADVVENGEHLEHFHSYQKPNDSQDEDTIEWHTDQGLFLVFTPGRKVHCPHKEESSLTGGFYIEQEDGSQALVEFGDEDDLVFMLGDGVNQYVNSRVEAGSTLRATPHYLSMPDHSQDEARVWYGRMVLPPSNAVHPEHGMTFGQLRQKMIDASLSKTGSQEEEALSLGCSSSMVARELQEATCEGDTILCWHRCMSIPDWDVSEAFCESRNLKMTCTNVKGQLWDETHGDFFPGCVELDAELATPTPKMPNYPRDEDMCADALLWDEFSSSTGYDHEFDLVNRIGAKIAKFMWSVEDGQSKWPIGFQWSVWLYCFWIGQCGRSEEWYARRSHHSGSTWWQLFRRGWT